MNICIIRHAYYPDDPRVLKEVTALCESGYSVDVICLKKSNENSKQLLHKVQVYRLPLKHHRASIFRYLVEYTLSFFMIFVRVTLLFLKRSYKCIQVNTMPDFLVFATLIPRLFGAKVLLDMHEPMPELFITLYGEKRYPKILGLISLIEQLAIKYAHKVITVNKTLRKQFIQRGADAKKIFVVRNVPDEKYLTNIYNESTNNDFVLLTHGTIEQRYGHELLIKAVAQIRSDINNLRVFIVGDGKNLEQVRTLTENIGCSDIVTFTGYVPFSKVGEYINKADIGLVTLLASPFAELCQPIKLFEYIAFKKPAIVSRLNAIQEIFDDSCVMFFEPGNYHDLARCIIEHYRNPAMRKELAENAYRRYKKICWRVRKKDYLNVIENLIGEPKK